MTRRVRRTATMAFFAAAAVGDPPVALAGEAGCPGCRDGGLAEDAGEVELPCPVEALPFLFPGGFRLPGRELRPRGQVPGGGESSHVGADLGDDDRGGGASDTGNLSDPPGRSRRGDHLLDPGVQIGDVRVDRIDPAEHLAQQERVVISEVPGERLLQGTDLPAHGGRATAPAHPGCARPRSGL